MLPFPWSGSPLGPMGFDGYKYPGSPTLAGSTLRPVFYVFPGFLPGIKLQLPMVVACLLTRP